jgi:hypothetical protein
MICQGSDIQSPHDVDRLYAKGLCQRCYMHNYYQEHIVELRAYRKAYRADPCYRELNKVYSANYRKNKGLEPKTE